MEEYRVEVSFTRKDLKDIVVDHQSMGSLIEPLKGKPVELYFSENGIAGWHGLIQEMRKFTRDGEAEFLFSAPSGPDSEKKRKFEEYLSQHGFRREDFKNLEEREKGGEERFEYARRCETRGRGQDALEAYRQAAQLGHAKAQYVLGQIYSQTYAACRDGNWVDENSVEAAEWYRRAALQHHTEAEFRFGDCCARGYGIEPDDKAAAEWYRKAADKGHMEAQFRLGDCYYNGSGVREDLNEAVNWYRKAAELGYAKAQFYLGECLYNGEGAEENKAEAVEWYRKAAELQYPDAEFSLAQCYAFGHGVKEDKAEAETWYRRAAEHGCADAKNRLKEAELDELRREEAAKKREEEQRRNQELLRKREREETTRRLAEAAAQQEKRTVQRIQTTESACGTLAGKAMKLLLSHGIDKWDGVWLYPDVSGVDEKLIQALGIKPAKERIFFAYSIPTEDAKKPRGLIMTDRRAVCYDDRNQWSEITWERFTKDKYEGVAINRKDWEVYLYRGLAQDKRVCRCLTANADRLLTFWQSLYWAARETRKAGHCLEKLKFETAHPDEVEKKARQLLLEHGAVKWIEAVEDRNKLCADLRVADGDRILFAHNGTHQHDHSGDHGFVITDQAVYFDADFGKEKLTWEEFAYDYYAVKTRDAYESKKFTHMYLYKLQRRHRICGNIGRTPEQRETFYQFWKELFHELRG